MLHLTRSRLVRATAPLRKRSFRMPVVTIPKPQKMETTWDELDACFTQQPGAEIPDVEDWYQKEYKSVAKNLEDFYNDPDVFSDSDYAGQVVPSVDAGDAYSLDILRNFTVAQLHELWTVLRLSGADFWDFWIEKSSEVKNQLPTSSFQSTRETNSKRSTTNSCAVEKPCPPSIV